MYTQCPECDTIFRVNAALLRAAQGQVRCGVCDATFDAIRFLTDEIESGVNAQSASHIHYEPQSSDFGASRDEAADPLGTASQQDAATPPLADHSLPLVAFEVADAANEWWATPLKTWPEAAPESPGNSPMTPAPVDPPSVELPHESEIGRAHV